MDSLAHARRMQDDLAALRRALHADPEVGLTLPRTQEKVLAALQGLPLEITRGATTTSITAVLRGNNPRATTPKTVLLRADMDALPLEEQTELEFAATNGAMHACGHDLHTAALVGAAKILCRDADTLEGDVVFMFQPGEEGCNGAGAMITEGVLDASGWRADHAYGLHVTSALVPGNTFTSRPGTIMASSQALDVTVKGRGGHGSFPHRAVDPVPIASEMVMALQSMVTRSFDIFDPVVVTVGLLRAGSARNVIPDTAHFEATIRAMSAGSAATVTRLIPRALGGIAQAHGADVDIDLTDEYPATVNEPTEAAYAADVITDLLGTDRYDTLATPLSGSEDFSRVLQEVPGAFIFLGACPPGSDPATAPSNHSPQAVFDDAVLADAAAVYATLAARRLSGSTPPLDHTQQHALEKAL